jgi:hypothetical protein
MAMARGLPVAEALRAAKLDALHRGVPPRDWAAFTAIGDPFTAIPLHQPADQRRRWLAFLGVLAAAATIVAVTRARRATKGRGAAA